MKFIRYSKTFLSLIITSTFLVSLLILFAILKNNVSFCEWYTRHIVFPSASFTGKITSSIPFSVSEIFMISFIILIVFQVIWAIILLIKLNILGMVNRLLTILVSALALSNIYCYSVEFAYNRKSIPLPTYQETVNKGEINNIISHYLDDFNQCASLMNINDLGELEIDITTSQLNQMMKDEYMKLTDSYYNAFTPDMKGLMTSWFFSSTGIVGNYYGPFNEAHYNKEQTLAELPFDFAHELAHAKGVMREEEANLLAAYICLSSSQPYLRYSGYLMTFSRLLSLAKLSDNPTMYDTFKNNISIKIKDNMNYINNYWKDKMWLNKVGEFFNDLYLKISGQKEGTNSYVDNPTIVDEDNNIISLSRYQNLYFYLYYLS